MQEEREEERSIHLSIVSVFYFSLPLFTETMGDTVMRSSLSALFSSSGGGAAAAAAAEGAAQQQEGARRLLADAASAGDVAAASAWVQFGTMNVSFSLSTL